MNKSVVDDPGGESADDNSSINEIPGVETPTQEWVKEVEKESGRSWEEWIADYAGGKIKLDSTPSPPQGIDPSLLSKQRKDICELSDQLKELDGKAVSVREVWEKKGYLRAALGPDETERRRVLTRFNLRTRYSGKAEIDRILNGAKTFFQVPTVVVSVILDDREVISSAVGWQSVDGSPKRRRIELPLETAITPHAMPLVDDSGVFIVMDSAKDWRFASNPFVQAEDAPIAFFASANIRLPTVGPDGGSINDRRIPSRLPIGSLCIMDSTPRNTAFTENERSFLITCADMVAREIEIGFHQEKHQLQQSRTLFATNFLHGSLVSSGSGPGPPSTSSISTIEAVEETKSLLGADSVAILDLRYFVPAKSPHIVPTPSAQTTSSLTRPPLLRNPISFSSEASSGRGSSKRRSKSLDLLAHSGVYDWEEATERAEASGAVSRTITAFKKTNVAQFDPNTIPSPLKELLPIDVTASLILPIQDNDNQTVILMVALSYTPYFRFDSSDRQFIANIGGIVAGGFLRQRIVEADNAKLAFISQVAHELLTPLHGVKGQLDLIRTLLPSPEIKTLAPPLLDVADVCVSSLKEILDDTLAFSKMTNSNVSEHQPRLTEVNLQSLFEEVIKSCWSRANQTRINQLASGAPVEGVVPSSSVDLMLDFRIKGDTTWKVDVGGLKRLLFNLIGNSLKFTEEGSVTVSVREAVKPASIDPAQRLIGIDVVDTGCGMSPEFMRDSLFVPFKQHDSFIQGTGLGVSMCAHIVKRMNGTLNFESALGHGTTASITLPLELADANLSGEPPSSLNTSHPSRNISSEMSLLFEAGMSPSGSVTPNFKETPSESSAMPTKGQTGMTKTDVRVLVIDDNAISARILTTFLTHKEATFAQAADGIEGVELFKSFQPHLVWTDLEMPRLNGIDAARQIREIEGGENRRRAHISVLSGDSSDSTTHSDALSEGIVDEWIVKGGPSLKTLGEIFEKMKTDLEQEKTDRLD